MERIDCSYCSALASRANEGEVSREYSYNDRHSSTDLSQSTGPAGRQRPRPAHAGHRGDVSLLPPRAIRPAHAALRLWAFAHGAVFLHRPRPIDPGGRTTRTLTPLAAERGVATLDRGRDCGG